MTPEQQSAQVARERAIQTAEEDLTAIAILLESPGWAYLTRRLTEMRQSIRDDIADLDLDHEKTSRARIKAKFIRELLRLPYDDRAAHQSTLANRDQHKAGPSKG
jgi:hypothetical protein